MKKLITFLMLAGSLCGQNTAVFPGRVATNSDLYVASNNFSTTLLSGISSTATSATVASTSGFTAPGVVTIDGEITAVCQVSGGNTLTFGKSGCPNVDGRGIDGSTAVSHLVNAAVQGRVVATLHNQMSAEVIALENRALSVVYVTDKGAKGDGSTDDTAAVTAAITDACSQYGPRGVVFPPTPSFYKITSTVPIGCSFITLSGGSDAQAHLAYSGTGTMLQPVGGNQFVTFKNLFLAGPGPSAGETYAIRPTEVNGQGVISHLVIRDSVFTGWGSQASGLGAAIRIDGDTEEMEISGNAFDLTGNNYGIWATGGGIDAAIIENNVFGVSPLGSLSNWAIVLAGTQGSYQQWVVHNNCSNPGGFLYAGPISSGITIEHNQCELLEGGAPIANAQHAMVYLGSSGFYTVRDNDFSLHGMADYGVVLANFNGGEFEHNIVDSASVSDWSFPNVAATPGYIFDGNQDFSNSSNVYQYPYYTGIAGRDWNSGYRGWGTAFPTSVFHFNSQTSYPSPWSFYTTLASAVTSNTQTTVTLTSAAGISDLDEIWIGGECMLVTDITSAPTLTVLRGECGGTTALSSIAMGTVVDTGPGDLWQLTNIPSQGTAPFPSISVAFGVDYTIGAAYAKVREWSGASHTFLADPLLMDGLIVESSQPGVVNTKAIIRGVNGQADYPFQVQDYLSGRHLSLNNSYNSLTLEGVVTPTFEANTSGGIHGFFGANDSNADVAAGSLTSQPYDLYAGGAIRASVLPAGGIRLISVSPPSCTIANEGTLYYVSGTPSTMVACMKSSTGAYANQTFFTSP